MATDAIDYVASDAWGNTATGTRTVIIVTSPSIIQSTNHPAHEASTTAATPLKRVVLSCHTQYIIG